MSDKHADGTGLMSSVLESDIGRRLGDRLRFVCTSN